MRTPDWLAFPETERERAQAGIALISCTLILGAIAYFFPWPAQPAVATPSDAGNASTTDAYADLHLDAKAAIVVDLSNGEPLYEKNADAQLPLASLTKLITTYAAAHALAPKAPIAITPAAIAQDGDTDLRTGEVFAFEDLARYALVGSSNDAAEAIAEAASRARQEDVGTLLKGAVAAAGLAQTYAVNGTGLDESATVSGGYGSARDVARLAGELLSKAPAIARATTEPAVTVTSEGGVSHTLPNTDTDVERFPNLLLSKTGYTDLAGGNLAIVFDAGLNHPVAAVVLGSTRDGRFRDMNALVEATLAQFAAAPAPPVPASAP